LAISSKTGAPSANNHNKGYNMNTTKTQPEDFKRRVLLAVAGGSPAILTETLYALTQTSQPAYLPTEIHIITTAGVYAGLKEKLLGTTGKIQALCADYHFPYPTFSEDQICRITDKNGQYLNDITTEADNETAADFITNKVRELTQDDAASLYVSIAGGRKTMSYYLGYAMSVFGRIQDRMSHVLVDDRYMSADFYYPTPQTQMMQPFKGKPFDASQVSIMLGELPFIRLRDGLTDDFLNDKTKSYSDIIKIAQRQLRPIKVELRYTPERKAKPWQLLCSGSEITGLNNAELAIYVWLLQRHKNEQTDKLHFNRRPNNEKLAQAFLAVYKQLFGEFNGGFTKAFRALVEDDDGRKKEGITGKYFSPKKTKINHILVKSLSVSGAANYTIIEAMADDCTYMGLPSSLQQDDIHLPSHLYEITKIRSQD
jgi:CRISPR-associated protein (TIGR02584 family)